MIERVGIACLRGAGDTVSGLVVMGIVNVINMAMSYALAVGHRSASRNSVGPASRSAPRSATAAARRSSWRLLIGGRAGFHLRLRTCGPTSI